MTATLPPLGPTSPVWELPGVVDAIAAGSDWVNVAAAAHDLAHPLPVQGCPGCPVSEACVWCGFPVEVCEDPVGHDRIRRQGEQSLRVGVGVYGRERAR